ncbi:interleukin-27 subunit alpha isoform X2 [Ciconia boyciana]|uniref:interleukin-27 subunit alpha isoform X2 n=1 Tax=Ciconia boyciana TaxID=52775 RepID=UPI003BA1E79A
MGLRGATWAGLSLVLLLPVPVAERLAGARLHLSPPPGHPLVVSIPARDWMALTARQRLGALGRRLATLRGRWGALGSGAGTRRWGALLRWDLRDLGRAIASELGEPRSPPAPRPPPPAPRRVGPAARGLRPPAGHRGLPAAGPARLPPALPAPAP